MSVPDGNYQQHAIRVSLSRAEREALLPPPQRLHAEENGLDLDDIDNPRKSPLDRKRLVELEIAKLQLDRERARLVDRDEVLRAWSARMAYFSSRVMRLGLKLRELAVVDDPDEVQRLVEEEGREMLVELAGGELGLEEVAGE